MGNRAVGAQASFQFEVEFPVALDWGYACRTQVRPLRGGVLVATTNQECRDSSSPRSAAIGRGRETAL
jgi:hypothetical protein